MFFLARCIFWFAIVFSSMSWGADSALPDMPLDVRQTVMAEGLAALGAAKAAAVDRIESWCIKSPTECTADAAKLTALVTAYAMGDADEPSSGLQTPLPVPRSNPLRHSPPRG